MHIEATRFRRNAAAARTECAASPSPIPPRKDLCGAPQEAAGRPDRLKQQFGRVPYAPFRSFSRPTPPPSPQEAAPPADHDETILGGLVAFGADPDALDDLVVEYIPDDSVRVQWMEKEEEVAAVERGEVLPGGARLYDYSEYDAEEEEQKASTSGRSGTKGIPADVRCFDTARIYIKGGDGGRGCVAFRREKYVPRGGPSGGNGGLGGSVWLEADASLNSLLGFRRRVHFRADPGVPGQGSDCHGAGGKDLTVFVPPGTIVRRKGAAEGEPPLAEVMRAGDKALLAAGGRGGRGNLAFKSGRNTAPTLAEFGEIGQGKEEFI